jgi:PqqA peptide cyclase
VCRKSPLHHLVTQAVDEADRASDAAALPRRPLVTEHPLVFRDPANSRRLSPAGSQAAFDQNR